MELGPWAEKRRSNPLGVRLSPRGALHSDLGSRHAAHDPRASARGNRGSARGPRATDRWPRNSDLGGRRTALGPWCCDASHRSSPTRRNRRPRDPTEKGGCHPLERFRAKGRRSGTDTSPIDTHSLNPHRKISADRRNILAQVEACSMRPDESSFTRSSSSIWAPAGRVICASLRSSGGRAGNNRRQLYLL